MITFFDAPNLMELNRIYESIMKNIYEIISIETIPSGYRLWYITFKTK